MNVRVEYDLINQDVPIRCRCGAFTYATMQEQRRDQPNGAHKCPTCRTFASDHAYWAGDEGRCMECDTREGSHR